MRKSSERGAKESGRQNRTRERLPEENSERNMSRPLKSRRSRRRDSKRSRWRRMLSGRPGKRRSRLSRATKRSRDKKLNKQQLKRRSLTRSHKRRLWRPQRKRTVELPRHVRLSVLPMPSARLPLRSPRRHKKFLNTVPIASLAEESSRRYAQRSEQSRAKLPNSKTELVQLPQQMLPLHRQTQVRKMQLKMLPPRSEELRSSSEVSDDLNETKPSRHI